MNRPGRATRRKGGDGDLGSGGRPRRVGDERHEGVGTTRRIRRILQARTPGSRGGSMTKFLVTIFAVAAGASLGYSGRVLHRASGDGPPVAASAPAPPVRADRVTALGRLGPHGG